MSEHEEKNSNKGFSLVELVIVIAIMAILAGIIGLNVIHYMEKGREAIDVNNAVLIRDALMAHQYPSDYSGRDMEYKDPETNKSEHFLRGWVYVDKYEIRASDPSAALALIEAGIVHVSGKTEVDFIDHEEDEIRWFPSGPDGDYVGRTGIGEYVFKNSIKCKARKAWNTYQLDVYLADSGELYMGASASNTIRVGGHAKDEMTAKDFAKRVGFDGSKVTPIGAQNPTNP